MKVLFWLLILAVSGCFLVVVESVGTLVSLEAERHFPKIDSESTQRMGDKRWDDNVVVQSLKIQASLVFAVVFAVQAIIVRKINKYLEPKQGLKT